MLNRQIYIYTYNFYIYLSLFKYAQPGAGTIAITGTSDLPGWEKNKDGEQISGFTLYGNSTEKMYIVKPDPFSAAADDCVLRPNWRLAMCQTKFGNVS